MARKSAGRAQKRRSWQDLNADILAALDLRSEFAALGIEITGATPSESGWLACRAIDRDDANPSAAVNVITGRYRDLGGEGLSLSFWDLAAMLQPSQYRDWQTARRHYAARAGVVLDGDALRAARDPAEHLQFSPPGPQSDTLLRLWLRHKPPITLEAFKAAGGRLAQYRGKWIVAAMPVFGPGLIEADPVGWILWNTTGKELPVYHGAGQPPTWTKMKTTGGSTAGLVGLHGLAQLASEGAASGEQPSPDDATASAASTVWLPEGPADLLAIFSILPTNHLAITNAGGATQNPSDWMQAVFAGRPVVIVRDCDQAGEAGGEKWSRWLASPAGAAAASVRWPRLPYRVRDSHGPDLRDWLNGLPAELPENAPDQRPRDWATLAAMAVDAEPIEPGSMPELSHTGQTGHPSQPGKPNPLDLNQNQSAVLESDDDPHRLARVNLHRYAETTDGRTLRFWRDEWYVWKHNRYVKITDGELRAKLCQSIKTEFDRLAMEKLAVARASTRDTANDKPPTAQKVSMSLVSNVMQATSGMVCVASDTELNTWLPANERKLWISTQSGILDINAVLADADREECLRPNSPQWFSTVSLPYQFDAGATCRRWEAFLERNLELDPERIKRLQEWAGYCLISDLSEQKFMILIGEGANGKSVFIAGLTALLGEENVSNVPLEVFGDRFSRTDTLGKLLNAAGDCGEIDKTAEGYIKAFTGDRMFFDRKGKPGLNCRPTARLIVACNNAPRIGDSSDAVYRRCLMVPWRIQIPEQERVRGMDSVEWWQASGELPGMLRWAILGLDRLRKQRGFTASKLCAEALGEYRLDNNPARAYLEENYEADPEGSVDSKDLYTKYCEWCKETGCRPLGDRRFGKEVARKFPTISKHRGTTTTGDRFYFYTGIKQQGGF
jgi:P4 family phage/plasmid primase-like protien